MRFLIIMLGIGFLSIAPDVAFACEQTVTLKVSGMTCGSCPYQVKSALKSVDGVVKADASLETGEAVVVFDNDKTNVAALTQAVINAGYPAVVKMGNATRPGSPRSEIAKPDTARSAASQKVP